METVILVVHLMIALAIIILVLLQRSSGGGLGIGGGGGMGDFATARSTANVLTKATTFCAILFFCTSLSLGIMAKNASTDTSDELFSDTEQSAIEEMEQNVTDALEGVAEEMEAETQELEESFPAIPNETE